MDKSDTKKTVCVACAGPKCKAPGCKDGKVQSPGGGDAPCRHCSGTGTCPSWST
ncbi:MAG TPA: hypothetical protein VMB50_17225 [Myxococcales bacterium]|nr:hypothetical protein [Myxococcales bacterium]